MAALPLSALNDIGTPLSLLNDAIINCWLIGKVLLDKGLVGDLTVSGIDDKLNDTTIGEAGAIVESAACGNCGGPSLKNAMGVVDTCNLYS